VYPEFAKIKTLIYAGRVTHSCSEPFFHSSKFGAVYQWHIVLLSQRPCRRRENRRRQRS